MSQTYIFFHHSYFRCVYNNSWFSLSNCSPSLKDILIRKTKHSPYQLTRQLNLEKTSVVDLKLLLLMYVPLVKSVGEAVVESESVLVLGPDRV